MLVIISGHLCQLLFISYIDQNNHFKTSTLSCYFDDLIKFEDFDLDSILIDEKSYKIYWFIIFQLNF